MYEQQVKSSVNKSVLEDAAWIARFDPGLIACLLESHMGLGFWRVEVPQNVVHLSKPILTAFDEQERDGPMPLAAMLDHFLPEDAAKLSKLIKLAADDRVGFTATVRMLVGKRTRVVELIADVDVDSHGIAVAVIGTLRDITQRAEADLISQGRSMLFKVLMRNVPSAIAVFDTKMRYLSASDHWAAGHGFKSTEELIGKCHYDVLPEFSRFASEHKLVMTGKTMRRKRAYLKDSTGAPIEQFCVMAPWYRGRDHVGGMIIMLGTVDINKTLKFSKKISDIEQIGMQIGDVAQ